MSADPPTDVVPPPSGPVSCGVCGSSVPIGSIPGTCPGCLLLGGLHLGARPDGGAAAAVEDDPSDMRIGMVIDRYQLERRLGRGGMGEVFLALQIAPVQRLVAVKVIKRGMDTEHIVARFQTERQSLALMDHPNIATVLDAGATPSGRPYFVMEHVEGVPINRYCTRHNLSLRDRVKLVLQVCSAVQHAHQKGIIHRDLKPSNLLVNEKDGQPLPKVIDFGLAKAVERDPSRATLVTEAGQILGTPDYMAPEQASGSPDADTRLDVYSLGAVLYELLAGQPPFVGKNPTEILRRVQEQDPVAPHTLNRTVDRDIETVCLKCLEKNPAHRYASADALADDLNRWLARRPVRARPVSSIGRMVKWAERRPGIAALSGALSVSLIAGTVGIFLAWRQAAKAREIAVAKERDALVEKARADRSSHRVGRRWAALTALKKAATIDPSGLADHVVSTLALDDIRVDRKWEGNPGRGLAAFDATFERYAHSFPDGRIEVRRMKDTTLLTTIPATGVPLKSVLRFSHNGKWLVSAHAPGEDTLTSFRLWNLGAGKEVLTGASREDAIDFGADGSADGLFAAATDKTITLWRLPELEVVARWEVPQHPYALRFSPDARTLAVTSADAFSIVLLDLATGDVRHLPPPQGAPPATDEAKYGVPSWHPSGHYLAGPAGDGRISLWDARSLDSIGVLAGHTAFVAHAVWHPKGDLIVSDSSDGTIALWDPATRQRIVHMDGGFMPNAGFSTPDGTHFGPARSGKLLSILETTKTDTRRRLLEPDPRECRNAEWDEAGAILATAGDVGVQLWDRTGHFLRRITKQPSHAAIFAGDSLITSGEDGVLRWPLSRDARAGNSSLTLGTPAVLLRDSASKQAAADSARKTLAVIQPGQLTVLDLAGTTAPQQVPAAARADSVSVSPDGRWIAAGNRSGTDVGLWEMPGFVSTPLEIGDSSRVVFSLDGHWLLVSTATEHQFWRVNSWEIERREPSHDATFLGSGVFGRKRLAIALSASRHQMRIVGATDFGEWEVAPEAAQSHPLCFSPDSTLLAAADESEAVEIWNLPACLKGLLEFGIRLPLPDIVPLVPSPPVTAVVASVFHEGQPESFPPRPAGIAANTLDLTSRYNAALDEAWSDPATAIVRGIEDASARRPGVMLGPLPESPWRLDGVDFDARGIVQLQGHRLFQDMPEFPRIIPRLPIGLSCHRLHLLHGSHWPEKDTTEVARHRVHYSDGSVEDIPILYGRDVRDWVLLASAPDSGQPPPAWQQPTTQPPAPSEWFRRLYHLTWENPHPGKDIESLSLISTMSTAAPFVLAITVE